MYPVTPVALNNGFGHLRDAVSPSVVLVRKATSGMFFFRGDHQLHYKSLLERDFLVRREFSGVVLDVLDRPVEIPFTDKNGQEGVYVPSFLVHYRAGDYPWGGGLPSLLVEVKSRAVVRRTWPELKPKIRAARAYARERGWVFQIHDESRIRNQVFANIMFLERYRRMQFSRDDPETTQWILKNLDDMGQAPIQYLLGRHFCGIQARAVGVSHLWHLLATCQMECDMTLPLMNDTVVWIPHHGN